MIHNALPFLSVLALLLFWSPNVQAQSPAPDTDVLSLIQGFEVEGCEFLEVSKEMFQLIASDERADEQMRQNFTQLNHLIYLNCFGVKMEKTNLASRFREKALQNNFKLLMRSESSMSTNHFYRRFAGEVNEYLLATETSIQYISTTLDITSIREMNDLFELAGDAGGL